MIAFVLQALTGLASASALFLVASGLSVIFGVTRVVNFAHGSLFMLGAYLAWSLLGVLPHTLSGFALGVLLAAISVAAIGAVLEMAVLRRLYAAPELLQLLATFAVVLIIQDAVQAIWGPADLSLPRPAFLRASLHVLGEHFPAYDLALIVAGPVVLGLLHLLFARTRFGMVVRAATENRALVAAFGIDQRRLLTLVFALGAGLAGLGGALALPDGSANTGLDLSIITDAFVVVVVGGMGSIAGAYLAALLIGVLQALGLVLLPQASLVVVFVIMAGVLVVRPRGLLGTSGSEQARPDRPALVRPADPWLVGSAVVLWLALAATGLLAGPFWLSVLTEAVIAVLFAASLHVMLGPGGMISFGHAAWFGIGAYAAALSATAFRAPVPIAVLAAPLLAGGVAVLIGQLVVRLSGVALAMLTLAFAQIAWAVAVQWSAVTGGDDGILGVWPGVSPRLYFLICLALCTAGTLLLRQALFAPFGFALRAARDAPLRAAASGLPIATLRLVAFVLSGTAAGLAGGLSAFAKGSVFPSALALDRSVDVLSMVLLGGVQSLSGPVIGALAYTGLFDTLLLTASHWRLLLGGALLLLVLVRPHGLAGRRA